MWTQGQAGRWPDAVEHVQCADVLSALPRRLPGDFGLVLPPCLYLSLWGLKHRQGSSAELDSIKKYLLCFYDG